MTSGKIIAFKGGWKFYVYSILLSLCVIAQGSAQETAMVFGKVSQSGALTPIEFVVVGIAGTSFVAETDASGSYKLSIPVDQPIKLEISRVGYQNLTYDLAPMKAGDKRLINFTLEVEVSGVDVIVRESRIHDAGLVQEQVEQLKLLPSASGNFESVLPSIALGTFGGTGGELTSQYNVRGGNYDENLVYVNDFEIYRPQLISNSQQEGLSFPNINLISNLNFSSGGFKASYGDKMSSVLDIRYKRPDSLGASLEMSLLGASGHIEGSMNVGKRKLRYLLGARYKTTRYLLNSLETEGEYNPDFADIQAYITYDFHKNWQLGVLSNFNRAVYRFIPESRTTAGGLVNFSLRLNTSFDGSENDEFTTAMTGVSLTFIPENRKNPIYMKLLASAHRADENERFDILGFYRLSQIDIAPGSDSQGEELALLGTGTQHSYTRNFLDLNIYNVQHKGGIEFNGIGSNVSTTESHFVEWGLKYQREDIDDRINEWERLDSAGYSIPYQVEGVALQRVLKGASVLTSNRFTAFLQNTYTRAYWGRSEYQLTLGVRASYWDLNEELLISPRAQLLFKPLAWKSDVSFKLAAGLYAQPPFYRELRGPDGSLNLNLKAQKSVHVVGGMTVDFSWKAMSDRDFRFIAEAYYKSLSNLVSYDVDNVRIRYSGMNDASGYVAGLDMRINGEFVPGTESWINLSFLRAREQLDGIQHKQFKEGDTEAQEVDYVPRPSDQAVALAMFFQDHLPNNESFRVHLNFIWGSGLPFGVKENNIVIRNNFRYSTYYRVDVGFSLLLWEASRRDKHPNHLLGFSKGAWVSLDIFNLLDVANDASNTWIKTIFNQQFAINNHLTSRRVNFRFHIDF